MFSNFTMNHESWGWTFLVCSNIFSLNIRTKLYLQKECTCHRYNNITKEKYWTVCKQTLRAHLLMTNYHGYFCVHHSYWLINYGWFG